MFDKEDFSGIADSLGNKIAIKAGSWGQIGSDVLLKDIHYTGQEEAVTYTVTGSVTDESGKALEGAVVTTGNLTAETDKDGKYSLQRGSKSRKTGKDSRDRDREAFYSGYGRLCSEEFPERCKIRDEKGRFKRQDVLRSDFGYQYGAYQRNRCETFQR